MTDAGIPAGTGLKPVALPSSINGPGGERRRRPLASRLTVETSAWTRSASAITTQLSVPPGRQGFSDKGHARVLGTASEVEGRSR